MYARSSIGDLHLTSNHMFRSVVELVEMVSHLMLYCFGKRPILDSKARKWNFIAGAKKSAEGLSSCLILTVLTIALQVVNAVMFVLLNANVQHIVVIVNLFPFHSVKLQATVIPSTGYKSLIA